MSKSTLRKLFLAPPPKIEDILAGEKVNPDFENAQENIVSSSIERSSIGSNKIIANEKKSIVRRLSNTKPNTVDPISNKRKEQTVNNEQSTSVSKKVKVLKNMFHNIKNSVEPSLVKSEPSIAAQFATSNNNTRLPMFKRKEDSNPETTQQTTKKLKPSSLRKSNSQAAPKSFSFVPKKSIEALSLESAMIHIQATSAQRETSGRSLANNWAPSTVASQPLKPVQASLPPLSPIRTSPPPPWKPIRAVSPLVQVALLPLSPVRVTALPPTNPVHATLPPTNTVQATLPPTNTIQATLAQLNQAQVVLPPSSPVRITPPPLKPARAAAPLPQLDHALIALPPMKKAITTLQPTGQGHTVPSPVQEGQITPSVTNQGQNVPALLYQGQSASSPLSQGHNISPPFNQGQSSPPHRNQGQNVPLSPNRLGQTSGQSSSATAKVGKKKAARQRKADLKKKMIMAKAASKHFDNPRKIDELDFDALLEQHEAASKASTPKVVTQKQQRSSEINKKRNNQTKSQPKATSIKSSELNIVTQRQKQQAKGTTQKQEQAKFEHKKPYEKKTFVPTIVCKYYLQGTCRQDGSCTFLHEGEVVPPPTSQTVCHYYKTGSCTQGEDCKFSHDLQIEPCRFFHMQGTCEQGDRCPYSHAPLDEEKLERLRNLTGHCRFYLLKGYCNNGDNCLFLHTEATEEERKKVESSITACRFYHITKNCKQGDDCFYLHDEATPAQVKEITELKK